MQDLRPDLELLNQDLYSNKFCRRYMCMLQFEKHSVGVTVLAPLVQIKLSVLSIIHSHQGRKISSCFGLPSSVPFLFRYYDCLDFSKETWLGYGETFASCLPLPSRKLLHTRHG